MKFNLIGLAILFKLFKKNEEIVNNTHKNKETIDNIIIRLNLHNSIEKLVIE